MRGEVLKPDDREGPGLILGEDGRRYLFTAARVHKGASLAPGNAVDFIPLGEDARDIYLLAAPAASPAPSIRRPAQDVTAASARSDGLFTYYLRAVTRDYFKFTGRSRRAEYWSFLGVSIVLLTACVIADTYLSEAFFGVSIDGEPDFTPMTSALFYIYSIVPSLSMTVRRLHDQGMSGWMLLLNFIPYLGGLILFILMFFDSHRQPNKHGPSPKYGPAQTVDVFS